MCPHNLSQQYPPLTPKIALWMERVSNRPALLNALFKLHGSPINLHHPGLFEKNYKAYKSVFDEHSLKHSIFFARKANPCLAFVRKARRLDLGVDTASYRELKQCLQLGCEPSRLVLTAAMKNERLVRLALKHEILIILNNKDECARVSRLADELGKTPSVGIRISGFTHKGQKLYSRFGFDIKEVADFITHHFNRQFKKLEFKGFHFHLDGYSIPQRAEALIQTLQQVDFLQERGITNSFIDMGGGLLTNYLSDKSEWDAFWNELKKAVRGERSPITFANNGLGYKMIEGELRGAPDVYPYYNEKPGDQFLDAVLSHQNESGESVASLLRKRDIELRMEPGRSLLDQTGMTIAKVAHRKKDQRGHWLVGLEMNRSQLFSSSADFLLDPLFIPMQSSPRVQKPIAVYFTGGYCLEGDIILKRKIVLPRLPEIGDFIAFPNTAGYMMHFYQTESHLFERATNLIAKPVISAESGAPFTFEKETSV